MERQIVLNGRVLTYELSRKRVRNINLRISPDGVIKVSCPGRTTIAEVENFMRSETDFIFRDALTAITDSKMSGEIRRISESKRRW